MKQVKVEIVSQDLNPSNLSIFINDVRITPRSTKPLGGGTVVKKWLVPAQLIVSRRG